MKISQSEIKFLRALQQKKGREKERKFLLEGWRPLLDALNSSYRIELIAYVPAQAHTLEHQSMLKRAVEKNIPKREITTLQLKQISGSVHSQGVITLIHQKERNLTINNFELAPLILACDRISDPGNLGTILRTCDWFGVDTVFLNEGCVSLYNEKVIRATAGSIFHLNVFEHLEYETLLPSLCSQGYRIIATSLDAKPLSVLKVHEKTILLVGSEAFGVDEKLQKIAYDIVSIPRYGRAESLNVGIATGIILAKIRNQSD